MALLTASMRRKRALLLLMAIFIVGNVLCAVAANYGYLMASRVVTAFCQGAFYGIGAVVAASLVPENRKGWAVSMMFAGLTLATVLGVPLGTALGQFAGWRAPFWAIAGLGILALVGLWHALPAGENEEKVDLGTEVRALRKAGIWVALGTTVIFNASMFALFTYVAPMLEEVTKLTPQGITWSLLSIGVGLTIGNYIGGRLADWRLSTALTGIAIVLALVSSAVRWTMPSLIPMEVNLFLWAVVTFASVPGLQVNVMNFGQKAPNLVATLNIGAFNVGNALGAWLGGAVISAGFGLQAVPVVAGVVALLAACAVQLSHYHARRDAVLAGAPA